MIYELKEISFSQLEKELKQAIDIVVVDGIYILEMPNRSIFVRRVKDGTIENMN